MNSKVSIGIKKTEHLHPLVVHIIDGDGNIQHNSLCLISDDNNHDANFSL